MKVSPYKFHTSLALVMLALLAACAGAPEPTTHPSSVPPTSAPLSPTKAPTPTVALIATLPPTQTPASTVAPTTPPSPTKAPQPTAVPTTSQSATKKPVPTAAPAAPISTTTGTTASAFPIGTFTTATGWTWQFKADGTQKYTVPDAFPGYVFATGTYTVTGNQILFVESTDTCGVNTQGTYTWAYDGRILSFKVVEEKCDFREGTAAYGHWEKQP